MTTAKTPVATPPKTAAKRAVKVQPPVAATGENSEVELKKNELIDMVVEKSGVKKKDAKPAIEALLAILGESLKAGRTLNLQPMGKMRVARTEDKANGRMIVCKLRQNDPGSGPATPKDPLADVAE